MPSPRLRVEPLEDRLTPAGTPYLVTNTINYDSYPANGVAFGNNLFFAATSFNRGRELFKSDGTTAGTVMVADIKPGMIHVSAGDSFPADLTPLGTTLYFSADDGSHGRELWKTDGTTAGTVLVKDINPDSGGTGSNPTNFVVFNGSLYFTADDGNSGRELWKSDGTAPGTVRVKDINSGANGSDPAELIVAGTTLYFAATDAATGRELWKSDGTAAGTVIVKDLDAGTQSTGPYRLTAVGAALYFQASNAIESSPLYKTDGTASGTVQVGFVSGPMAAFNGDLYFVAPSNFFRDYELHKTDGSPAGTVLVKDINPGTGDVFYPDGSVLIGDASSHPSNFLVVGNTLYFSATDGTNGRELWKTDGTTAGTAMVADIAPGGGNSFPADLTAAPGNTLFFTATDGTNGRELWQTDGTAGGTFLVKDLDPGTGSDFALPMVVVVGNTVFFSAADATYGRQLWAADATPSPPVISPPPMTPPPTTSPAAMAHLSAAAAGGTVRVANADGTVKFTLTPYPGYTGPVSVAVGDVTGDGVDDVVTGSASTASHVKVFDGATGTEIASFFAYQPGFAGGVRVAIADVLALGHAEVVTGAGPGGAPHVKVFDVTGGTAAERRSFFAYDATFTGGVNVAAGVLDGSGHAQVVTGAGPGGAPHVKAFDVSANGAPPLLTRSFFAYDAGLTGGVFVAAADGLIATGAGPGGGPHVKLFNYPDLSVAGSFFAYEDSFRGGVRVALSRLNGAPTVETGAGAGGGPVAKAFRRSDLGLVAAFGVGDLTLTGGVFVG